MREWPVNTGSIRAHELISTIWFYVAAYNERAADKLVGNITSKFEVLLRFSLAGRERSELTTGLRSLAVEPYTIFYRVHSGIEIVRVMHGSQDITEDDFE